MMKSTDAYSPDQPSTSPAYLLRHNAAHLSQAAVMTQCRGRGGGNGMIGTGCNTGFYHSNLCTLSLSLSGLQSLGRQHGGRMAPPYYPPSMHGRLRALSGKCTEAAPPPLTPPLPLLPSPSPQFPPCPPFPPCLPLLPTPSPRRLPLRRLAPHPLQPARHQAGAPAP